MFPPQKYHGDLANCLLKADLPRTYLPSNPTQMGLGGGGGPCFVSLGWLMVTTFFSVCLETFLFFVPLTNLSDPERARHSKMGGDEEGEREGGGPGEQEVPTQGSYVASHCFSDPIQTPSGPETVRRVCTETVCTDCVWCAWRLCVCAECAQGLPSSQSRSFEHSRHRCESRSQLCYSSVTDP